MMSDYKGLAERAEAPAACRTLADTEQLIAELVAALRARIVGYEEEADRLTTERCEAVLRAEAAEARAETLQQERDSAQAGPRLAALELTDAEAAREDDTARIESRDEDIQSWMAAYETADRKRMAAEAARDALAVALKEAHEFACGVAIHGPGAAFWESARQNLCDKLAALTPKEALNAK